MTDERPDGMPNPEPLMSIGDTYAALGAWVAHHATSARGQVREIYEVSIPDTQDPSQYRTAIYWPVTDVRNEPAPTAEEDS